MRILDLSQEIYHRRAVPGSQIIPVVWTHVSHEESAAMLAGTGFSYMTKGIIISDHCGTHVDAFTHIDPRPEAEAIDQIPLERFYSPAICIDVSRTARGEYIRLSTLRAAVAASGQEVRPGDAVLLYTGFPERPTAAEFGRLAGLDAEAATWLADQGVVNIGTDAWSLDRRTPEEAPSRNPAHIVCRDRKILNTENLAIPLELIGRRFTFVCLPLKIRGASGSPVRAIAIMDE
jgi:kynurenine formamidase